MTAVGFRSEPVQRLRLLMGRRSARDEARLFAVEGRKTIAEAIASGARIDSVFVDTSAAGQADIETVTAAQRAGAAVTEVQPGVLTRVCDAVSPQPVVATVHAVDVGLAALAGADTRVVAVLAGVADPGNAGSILRSVGAAGDGAVVLCEGSVDLYNPKTVRSSAGAVFRVPVVKDAPAEGIAEQLRGLGFTVLATSARSGPLYTGTDLSGRLAIVLGNEAHGLPPGIVDAADGSVRIPMAEGAESLGVAAAGAVIFFEAARQRQVAERNGAVGRVAGAA